MDAPSGTMALPAATPTGTFIAISVTPAHIRLMVANLSVFYLSPYHYVPTESVCVAFVSFFILVTCKSPSFLASAHTDGVPEVLHVIAAIRYRLWWLLPTVCLAGGGEIAGWFARLASSHNALERNPFLIQ